MILRLFLYFCKHKSGILAYDKRYHFSWNRKWYWWYLQISYITCHESWGLWFSMGNIYSECSWLSNDWNPMGSDKPYTKHFTGSFIVPHGWLLWWIHYILNFLKREFGTITGQSLSFILTLYDRKCDIGHHSSSIGIYGS